MEVNDLQQYADAWNEHDIDKIMSYMTEDCIFETGGGTEQYGTRFEGFDAVKTRFIEVWTDLPDISFENATHFVGGNRGCSQWTIVASRPDGTKLEVDGCDLFTFRDGKIHIKNSLMKNRQ